MSLHQFTPTQGVKTGVKCYDSVSGRQRKDEIKFIGYLPRVEDGETVIIMNELPGGGYGAEPQTAHNVGDCISKTVSRLCAAMINVPV